MEIFINSEPAFPCLIMGNTLWRSHTQLVSLNKNNITHCSGMLYLNIGIVLLIRDG